VIDEVRLVGHADRLNGTGQAAYNQRLSERRVATVRDALVNPSRDKLRLVVTKNGTPTI
jgi:outer membrane protein OmpA-like peptidoglycan-associated protein